MKNLVRRINQPVICDTYTCNNMAEFEISHEVVRAASMQVCPECLKDQPIRRDGEVGRNGLLQHKADDLFVDEHRAEDSLLRIAGVKIAAHRNLTPPVSTSRFGGCGYSSSLSRYTLSH